MLSVCIPTWEQYGFGKNYLNYLFKTLLKQTISDFEVVISDHSIDNSIYDLTIFYKNELNIKYFRNKNNRGNSSLNTNNSILHSKGDIIKIMFQDDFFYDNDAIKLILKRFESEDCKWLVSGCNHTLDCDKFYNYMIPYWNENIIRGINTISSPSVLSFKRDVNCLFDENLTMLMDCEFYYQLYKKHGLPEIIDNCLVTNRIHENQISQKYNKNINDEIMYVLKKHNYE
jgi:hypothetical protein